MKSEEEETKSGFADKRPDCGISAGFVWAYPPLSLSVISFSLSSPVSFFEGCEKSIPHLSLIRVIHSCRIIVTYSSFLFTVHSNDHILAQDGWFSIPSQFPPSFFQYWLWCPSPIIAITVSGKEARKSSLDETPPRLFHRIPYKDNEGSRFLLDYCL